MPETTGMAGLRGDSVWLRGGRSEAGPRWTAGFRRLPGKHVLGELMACPKRARRGKGHPEIPGPHGQKMKFFLMGKRRRFQVKTQPGDKARIGGRASCLPGETTGGAGVAAAKSKEAAQGRPDGSVR